MKPERRQRRKPRRAPCPIKCPCICHDTQGGIHDHYGKPCRERERNVPEWLVEAFTPVRQESNET